MIVLSCVLYFYAVNCLYLCILYPHCFCTIPHYLHEVPFFVQKYGRTQFCTRFVLK